MLTVGTIAVPNLANKGQTVGKSVPMSQILAPPVIDPDRGFTSISIGVDCRSVLGGMIASELGPAFGGS